MHGGLGMKVARELSNLGRASEVEKVFFFSVEKLSRKKKYLV